MLWLIICHCFQIFSEEGDLIAKRTRSQFPLLDTPIETIEGMFSVKLCCINIGIKTCVFVNGGPSALAPVATVYSVFFASVECALQDSLKCIISF